VTSPDLVVLRPEGLYCPPGDFWIDPWRPVPRAVITHAHADHARSGHGAYLASAEGAAVLRARVGAGIALQTLAWGEAVEIAGAQGGVRLSLHPAGHVLGSAQVRLEHRGQVWVVSGDYFVCGDHDDTPGPPGTPGTCTPFEPLRCDCFVTESTFGLPIYRWRPQRDTFADIDAWWATNAAAGRASLLLGYSFGKAQRLLAGVNPAIGPIAVHDTVEAMNAPHRAAGIRLPETRRLDALSERERCGALVIAPPAVLGSAWAAQLGEQRSAFASGWMQLRQRQRRAGVDRGFVLSDHADWPGLLRAIRATGAERVIVTHGAEAVLLRWLREQGWRADTFRTAIGNSSDDSGGNQSPPAPAEAT
jgi:putative mRNA 3-end processing factor